MPSSCSLVGRASLIVGLLLSAGQGHAFELGNFKSGMSSAEARAAAVERGWTMVSAPPPLEPKGGSASRTYFDMTNGRTSLEFCNDKLAGVRTVMPEGFKGVVSVMADLIDRYGEPRTTAHSLDLPLAEASSLSFNWDLKDGERREILYTNEAGAEEPWALYFLSGSPGLCEPAP